ncbi:MAG: hypothetical protein AAFY24_10765 [Pseudomonadota bacterium]
MPHTRLPPDFSRSTQRAHTMAFGCSGQVLAVIISSNFATERPNSAVGYAQIANMAISKSFNAQKEFIAFSLPAVQR